MEKLVTPALLPFRKPLGALALLIVAAALSGCAESSANGDPGARALPMGQSCQSIRAELNRLDSRGAQGKVQAAAEGRRLGPGDMEVVNRYNSLLGQYLGARCHV